MPILNLSWNKKPYRPLLYSLLSIAIIGMITQGLLALGYHVVYVCTPSVPKGLYLVTPIKTLATGDLVEFSPPPAAQPFLFETIKFPPAHTMLKYIAAGPGDYVCIRNQQLTINKQLNFPVARNTPAGKALPQSNFCAKIPAYRYMLIGMSSPNSFDSRYFGPVPSQYIHGRAVPILLF